MVQAELAGGHQSLVDCSNLIAVAQRSESIPSDSSCRRRREELLVICIAPDLVHRQTLLFHQWGSPATSQETVVALKPK